MAHRKRRSRFDREAVMHTLPVTIRIVPLRWSLSLRMTSVWVNGIRPRHRVRRSASVPLTQSIRG